MNGMLWIGSFGLIVVGVLLLIRGVRQILRAVGGPVLLKLPSSQNSGQFVVGSTGRYAIWQAGRTIQRVPVKMAMPTISALPTGEELMVHPSLSGVWVNNGWEGRILLYTFWAKAGQYQLNRTDHPANVNPESAYSLEIRERKPGYLLVFGILLLIFAGACLISGLVLPFMFGLNR